MDHQVPLFMRTKVEQEIKRKLALVYPNALPDVLASEVGMIETKAFVTSKTRGEYLINVCCYITAHRKRVNGAVYVQRIPALTRQEENARRTNFHESIIAGEDKMADERSQSNAGSDIRNTAPPSMPLVTATLPPNHSLAIGTQASPYTLPTGAEPSNQSHAAVSAAITDTVNSAARSNQPTSPVIRRTQPPAAAIFSRYPQSRGSTPWRRNIPEAKILHAQKALVELERNSRKKLRNTLLQAEREKTLRAKQALEQRENAFQAAQMPVTNAQNSNRLQAQHIQGLQALHPQAQQTCAQLPQTTDALQMQQLQSLQSNGLQIQQMRALQAQQASAGLQTTRAQTSQAQQLSQMNQRGSQIQVVSQRNPYAQPNIQRKRQRNPEATAPVPSHLQAIAPPQSLHLSQTQPWPFKNPRGQLQTIEQTQNAPEISDSAENLIRPTGEMYPQNRALPGVNALMPPNNFPQAQVIGRNQAMPRSSSVLQVQPMSQLEISPCMLPYRAARGISDEELLSLFNGVYSSNSSASQRLPQLQSDTAQSLPNINLGRSLLPQQTAHCTAKASTNIPARTRVPDTQARMLNEQKKTVEASKESTSLPEDQHRISTPGASKSIGQATNPVRIHGSNMNSSNRRIVGTEGIKGSANQMQNATVLLNATNQNLSKHANNSNSITKSQVQASGVERVAMREVGADYGRLTLKQPNLNQGSTNVVMPVVTTHHGPSKQANSVHVSGTTGQSNVNSKNLGSNAGQRNNTGVLVHGNQPSANTQTKDHHSRQLSASQSVKNLDVKRVQDVVKLHVQVNVENKIREQLAKRFASRGGNPGPAQTTQQNTRNPTGNTVVRKNTNSKTIGEEIPTPSSHHGKEQVTQPTMAATANPAATNLLTDNTKSLPTVPVNQTDIILDPLTVATTHGNVEAAHIDVPVDEETVQIRANATAENLDQGIPPTNSRNVGKSVDTPQSAAIVVSDKSSAAFEKFIAFVDETPMSNEKLLSEEIGKRTNEQAINDGQRTAKRTAGVGKALVDLKSSGMEIQEDKKNMEEPAAKRDKKLTWQEHVEIECQILETRYNYVKYVILEEGDKLVVTCSVDLGKCKIPNLKIDVHKGYPLHRNILFDLEEPASGWKPPYEDMRSCFLRSMAPFEGDCGITTIVSKWMTEAQKLQKSD